MPRRSNKKYDKARRTAADVKRKFTILCWIATIIFVGFVVTKHIAQEQFQSTDSQEFDNSNVEQLQQIIVADSIPNVVVHYKAYTVYFNPQNHEPNVTVYELTAQETEGNQPRANNFIHDENVSGCAHAWDYSNSGYDRGHMTPAADMKWDAEAMEQSFFMTNICPQNRRLNSGGWSRLEKKVRSWACRDSSLIVATGPIFTTHSQGSIGKEVSIPVPDAFFKVVYAPRQMRAIAFIYPNDDNSNRKIKKYAVSVSEVERLTGLDFLSALNDNDEQRIESQSDYLQWEADKQ